jgi:hypothetical protein
MTNTVAEIVDYDYNPQLSKGRVTAIIEDFVVVYSQTYDDPCEMGPALCEADFQLFEEEEFPTDTTELESFFQDLDLDWRVVDQSDDSYEDD